MDDQGTVKISAFNVNELYTPMENPRTKNGTDVWKPVDFDSSGF